jgi:hypothetical protein
LFFLGAGLAYEGVKGLRAPAKSAKKKKKQKQTTPGVAWTLIVFGGLLAIVGPIVVIWMRYR